MLTAPLLLLASASAASAGRVASAHGVPPALAARYVPKGESWACLDGSRTIAWGAVNDDYCDCPDGSDEPGTGACKNTVFYCANEGHVGGQIPSSHVNDGLCEKECCDGSDEAPGVCNNTCAEIGRAHREQTEKAAKLRKTGGKIRSTYIAFAQKEKARLAALVSEAEAEIETREREVARLKDIATRTESISAAALEHRKLSPLYSSLQQHALALKSLRAEHERALAAQTQLEEILAGLRTAYNPNYQDMAVLAAVRDYEAHAKLPHINDVRSGADADADDDDAEAAPAAIEDAGDGLWSGDELEEKIDGVLGADYETLLLEHDKHVGTPDTVESILFDVANYLPDTLKPQYETLRQTILGWLGAAPPPASDNNEALTRARANLAEGERALADAQRTHDDGARDLRELFSPTRFGAQGEWKKLDKTCLEHNAGEYTYEICMFDEARQKPNKGGQTFSLGRFSGWNTAAPEGSPEYYSAQSYTNGAKCWNGPARSVVLRLTCGLENELLTVAELEKCEYEITGTSPALCAPLAVENGKREEL